MGKARTVTLQGKYSDIVLGHTVSTDPGFNFKEMNITWAANIKAGMIVKADGTLVANAAAAADSYGVIVDQRLMPGALENAFGFEVGTAYPIVVAVRGLTLNFHKLLTADGQAATDAVIAPLEKNGNVVTKNYSETKFSGQN